MAEEGELEGLTQAHAAGVPGTAATWDVGRADWHGWGVAVVPQLQVRRGDRVPCVRRAREGGSAVWMGAAALPGREGLDILSSNAIWT